MLLATLLVSQLTDDRLLFMIEYFPLTFTPRCGKYAERYPLGLRPFLLYPSIFN